MNIVQRPDSISLSGNMKPFVVSSANPVRFQLSIGDTQIIDETYHPDTSQNIYIDVKNVVVDRLSFTLSDLAVYNQSGVVAAFSATFNGSNAYSFSVIRAGVDDFSDVATNFLKANFLTWQNQEKMVGYSQPEFLTYYAVVASKLKLKAYFSDNTNATVELSALTASCAYTADLSYSRISGRWTNKTLTYYDVWVEDAAGTRLSYVQRYIASAVKRLDEWFLFENSLGGIDTAVMGGDTDFAMQLESEMILTDDSASDDITTQDKTYNKNTGNLTHYERKWILDFFVSKRRYKVVNGQLRAISIMSSDVQATLSENLHAFNFTYIFANATSFLNLQRRDDLPAGIQISMPDNVAFIEPRLNELPRLNLSDDILFPVQSPYAEKFGTTTWGAIRDAVEKKIASEIAKIPVPDIPETLPPSKHTHEIEEVSQLKTELERRLLKSIFDENFSVTEALVEVLKDWKVNGSGVITNNLRVLGETYTYSADGIETFEVGGGAQYLWELADVDPEVKNAPDGSVLVKNAGMWHGVDTISIDCGNYKIV